MSKPLYLRVYTIQLLSYTAININLMRGFYS